MDGSRAEIWYVKSVAGESAMAALAHMAGFVPVPFTLPISSGDIIDKIDVDGRADIYLIGPHWRSHIACIVRQKDPMDTIIIFDDDQHYSDESNVIVNYFPINPASGILSSLFDDSTLASFQAQRQNRAMFDLVRRIDVHMDRVANGVVDPIFLDGQDFFYNFVDMFIGVGLALPPSSMRGPSLDKPIVTPMVSAPMTQPAVVPMPIRSNPTFKYTTGSDEVGGCYEISVEFNTTGYSLNMTRILGRSTAP
jgi:hypothetical protein